MAVFLTLFIYPFFSLMRKKLRVQRQMCLCVNDKVEPVSLKDDGTVTLMSTGQALIVSDLKNCQEYYQGRVLSFDSQKLLDKLHFFSAGLVSFARGLNDTPKIVSLLLITNAISLKGGIFLVGLAIAIGGVISSKKVAYTMSKRITKMNHGQGFSANLVTAFLVIFASKLGVPVSTTHVSCGSLFGIGMVNKKANFTVIKQIVLAWALTLPLAAILSGLCFFVLCIKLY